MYPTNAISPRAHRHFHASFVVFLFIVRVSRRRGVHRTRRIIARAAWKGRRDRAQSRFRSFLRGESIYTRGHRLLFYAAMKLSLG